MKKGVALLFTISALILFPTVALGINSPAVTQNHGVVTGMFISDLGLSVGAEYGFTKELGVTLQIWEDWSRIGAKYELKPEMAVVGGILEKDPYLGINGAFGINRNFQGLYEVDLYMSGGDFMSLYELGVKMNLADRIDLRGGLLGLLGGDENDLYFQLGLGYRF